MSKIINLHYQSNTDPQSNTTLTGTLKKMKFNIKKTLWKCSSIVLEQFEFLKSAKHLMLERVQAGIKANGGNTKF